MLIRTGSVIIAAIVLTICLYFLAGKCSIESALKEMEVIGVIDSVKTIPHRGGVYFLVNRKWEDLYVYGYSMANQVEPFDSLVKLRGNDYVIIYRKSDHQYKKAAQFQLH